MTAALIGLGPVVLFLAALVFLDSYKLVKLRMVVAIVACGMAVAVVSYFANGLVDVDFRILTRYVAPVIEEFLKALIIVVLIRKSRIGFLVDAAILGFAVGTGFSMVENIHYMLLFPDANIGTWLARGVGTAVMHGGCTAIFAVATLALLERNRFLLAVVPGFVMAVVLHSAYNHFFLSPFLSIAGIAVAFPLLLSAVFRKSEAAVGDWLGKGFDADTEMLELINSGRLSDSPIGRYIDGLRHKFDGAVVVDLLCYLQLYTELAIRAKGILMMRETGFEVPVYTARREKVAEMRFLEAHIGRTGLLALKPMLHMSHKDLWQLYMIGK
jgi:RsiW-degrading membrane proteinase PrsW (M82 family)